MCEVLENITVKEVVEASKNGSLKEMFRQQRTAGCLIHHIAYFWIQNKDYDLPELKD